MNLQPFKDVFGDNPHVVHYGVGTIDDAEGVYVMYTKKPLNFDYLKDITSVDGVPVQVRYMGPMAPLGGPT